MYFYLSVRIAGEGTTSSIFTYEYVNSVIIEALQHPKFIRASEAAGRETWINDLRLRGDLEV